MSRSTDHTRRYSVIVRRAAHQAVKLASTRKSAAQRRADLDGSLKTAAAALSAAWQKDATKLLKLLQAEAAKLTS